MLSVIAFNQQLERTRSSVYIGQVRCERCIFYQAALSMKCDGLPRASNVEAARSKLNKTYVQWNCSVSQRLMHIETAIREEITRLVSVFTNISNIWTVCLAKRKVTLAWKSMANYKFSAQ